MSPESGFFDKDQGAGNGREMEKYSEERKAAVLRKMLPPMNCSIKELAKQEGISDVTLYAWRRAAKMEGIPVPGVVRTGEDWSAEAKLAAKFCHQKKVEPTAEVFQRCSTFRGMDLIRPVAQA